MLKNKLCILTVLLIPLSHSGMLAQQSTAHSPNVDLGAFIKEVMVVKIEDNRTQLAMWLPFDFFVAATVQRGESRVTTEKDLEFLKPYHTIAIQNSIEKPDGSTVYAAESEVRKRAVLRLDNGTEIPPIQNPPPMITATIAAMKSLVSAEGDAGSANMHFLVFPATTSQGTSVVQMSQKDKLTLVLKGNSNYKEASFVWRTPFDALTKAKDCPKCGAPMSPKWSYCPYDGQKLPQ